MDGTDCPNSGGSIDDNPLFARDPSPGPGAIWGTPDDDFGDLHLGAASPVIDAGNNNLVPPGITTDLAGNPRIFDYPGVDHSPGLAVGFTVDMSAYELLSYIIYPPVVTR